MGVTSSTYSVWIKEQTNVTTNIINQNMVECATNLSSTQLLQITAGGNIDINSITAGSTDQAQATCILNVTQTADTESKIDNQIAASLTTNLSDFPSLNLASDTEENIKEDITNNLKTNLTFSNIQRNVISAALTQEILLKAGGNVTLGSVSFTSITDLVSSTVATIVSNAVVDSLTKNGASAKLDATVTNFVSDWLKDIGNIFSGPVMVIIAIIVLVIIGALVLKHFGHGGVPGMTPGAPTPPVMPSIPSISSFTPSALPGSVPSVLSSALPFASPAPSNPITFPTSAAGLSSTLKNAASIGASAAIGAIM